jgi:hypothetical protein
MTQNTTLVATPRTDQPSELERWTLTAGNVTAEGARFTPSRTTLDTAVSFGDTARVELRYTVATGAIAVAITGLPAGLAGAVKVLGPAADSTTRTLTATTTLTGLEPGRYRVISAPVVQQGITYRPAADTLAVDVVASLVAAPAPVSYSAQVGRLVLQSSGLPTGSNPALRVVGNGIDRSFTSAGTVDSLPVGTYTVTAAPVLVDSDRWAAAPVSQTLTITTGNASTASFTYALASGALAVSFTGLPSGLNGNLRVSGPNGYTRTVSAAETLAELRHSGLLQGKLPGGAVVETAGEVLPEPMADELVVPLPNSAERVLHRAGPGQAPSSASMPSRSLAPAIAPRLVSAHEQAPSSSSLASLLSLSPSPPSSSAQAAGRTS